MRCLLLVVSLFLTIGVRGQIIPLEQAEEIGCQFLTSKLIGTGTLRSDSPGAKLNCVYFSKDEQDNPLFYVFNKIDDKGFVLVSARSKSVPVLGYSLDGKFNLETMTDDVAALLDSYGEELKHLARLSDAEANIGSEVKRASSKVVEPLLGTIAWGQGDPYNALCPVLPGFRSPSATGCGATAIAQIMYYYKWPERGQGSNLYNYKVNIEGGIHDIKVDANFDIPYQWSLMKDVYSEDKTDPGNAVATLMFHCGAAMNMTYLGGSSGAVVSSVGNALITHFGYRKDLRLLRMDQFTIADWTDLLKEELIDKRPVPLFGFSQRGGHAFVCDGFDENDFFHINWGWEGVNNGYFRILSLNPYQEVPPTGFSRSLSALTHVYPDYEGNSTGIAELRLGSDLQASVGTSGYDMDRFSVRMEFFNIGSARYAGKFRAALLDEEGNLLGTSFVSENFSLNTAEGYIAHRAIEAKVSTLPDGTYLLKAQTQPDGLATWVDVEGNSNVSSSLIVTLKGGNANIKMEEFSQYRLKSSYLGATRFSPGENVSFLVDLKNEGDREYAGSLGLCWGKEADLRSATTLFLNTDCLLAGNSYALRSDFVLPNATGEYNLFVVYEDERGLNILDSSIIPITVTANPTSTQPVPTNDDLDVFVRDGHLIISTNISMEIGIYDVSGKLNRMVRLSVGENYIVGLGHGTYVIQGNKIIL